MPRSALDGLISRAQELGAKGLVWAFREGDGWRSPTAKFLTAEELAALNERLGAEEGDLLLVVADKPKVANAVLGQLRLDLAAEFGLIPEGSDDLLWIVDWPLMERERGGRLGPAPPSVHRARPATSTRPTPGGARALAYDVVWNGQEMGGGSIRISDPEVQRQGLRRARHRRGGGRGALRLPARGAALRRAAARRHRLRARPDRPAARRRRLDPRRDRLPEDGLRRRPADRRARPGRRGASCARSGCSCAPSAPEATDRRVDTAP